MNCFVRPNTPVYKGRVPAFLVFPVDSLSGLQPRVSLTTSAAGDKKTQSFDGRRISRQIHLSFLFSVLIQLSLVLIMPRPSIFFSSNFSLNDFDLYFPSDLLLSDSMTFPMFSYRNIQRPQPLSFVMTI